MSLRFGLVLTLWLIAALAALATLALATADAYRTADRYTHTTLARAGGVLERNYHMEPRTPDPLYAERTSLMLLSAMAPGTCIHFEQPDITPRRLCAGWEGFGRIAPDRFRVAATRLFGAPQPVARSGTGYQNGTFMLEVSFDPVAAATMAWQRVRLALWQTVAFAAGVLVVGTLAILWRLQPVRGIVSELDRLAQGDLAARVEPGGAREFLQIAQAVNRLSEQLRASARESRALTRQLLEVQDMERRQLARDLHDEFGQTLTATAALAASITYVAPLDRPDIARDAEAVGANIRSMMECLRGAFARLRPPDLEQVGLSSSLHAMLAGWEAQRGVRLTLDCDLDDIRLSHAVALDLYRIVQECVTNAMRHGDPTDVRVTLQHGGDVLQLTVEDDGKGSLEGGDAGHGLLGMRERVAAMGGRLWMEETDAGVRARVVAPIRAEDHAA